MESSELVELYSGKGAAEPAGYDSYQAFAYALKRYPIPEQGYRHNGKPAWTREHLRAWRATVPAPGWAGKQETS